MGTSSDQVSQALAVVGAFYDSILSEAHWEKACESFADYCGGTAAAVICANPAVGTAHAQAMRVDPHFTQQYEQYYFAREIRIPPALRFEAGVVMTENMLVDADELRRSELYNELLLPAQIPHFMFAWLSKSPTRVETVVIENSATGGAFQASAMERYHQLMPHVSRAARLRSHFARAREAVGAARAILDTLPYGIVFLDSDGLIVEMSRPAELMVSEQDAIGVFKCSLRAVVRDQDARLQRAISSATRPTAGRLLGGATLRLSRTEGPGGVTAHVVPLRSDQHSLLERGACAMVLLIDPDASPRAALNRVQISLQLTHAESLLADRLFRGDSLRDAAQALDVSINTAKSQLKAIYAKTGSSNHVELARKLMTISLAPEASSLAI